MARLIFCCVCSASLVGGAVSSHSIKNSSHRITSSFGLCFLYFVLCYIGQLQRTKVQVQSTNPCHCLAFPRSTARLGRRTKKFSRVLRVPLRFDLCLYRNVAACRTCRRRLR